MTNLTEGQRFLKAIALGDEQAFEALFIGYFPKVKRFMSGLLQDEAEAEDLAQDIFIRLWQNKHTLDKVENLNAYLYQAARNSVLQYIRKQLSVREYAEKVQAAFDKDNTLGQQNTEDVLYAGELELLVQITIEQMPPQQQKIYRMSRHEGQSNEEIATALLISKRTVENHLTKALTQIRKAIKNTYLLLF